MEEIKEFVLYKRRWYILFVFSLLSYEQSLFWITYSPIAKQTQAYYNCSEPAVNLLLAWGPIAYIPSVLFFAYFLGSARGTQACIKLAAVLLGLGGSIRLIACIDPKSSWALYVVSLSQICTALAGPIVMSAPPKLSAIWFSPDERTIATSISASANNLGTAIGFIAATYLYKWFGMQWFLVIEGVHGLVVSLMVLVYFPEKPPTPPSHTASLDDEFDLMAYWEDIKALCSNWSFVLLVFVGGLQSGLFSAWQGLFSYLLIGYSDLLVGWIGTGNVFGGWVGSILAGIMMDKFVGHRFKEVIIAAFAAGTAFLVLFTLSFPSFISPHPVVHSEEWLIILVVVVIGFLFGLTYPLFYEFGVELTYPRRESSSASLFTLLNNIACLIGLFTGGYIHPEWINSMVTGSMIVCLGLLALIRSQYNRSKLDEKITDYYATPSIQ